MNHHKDTDSVEKVIAEFKKLLREEWYDPDMEELHDAEAVNWLRTRIQSFLESVAREIEKEEPSVWGLERAAQIIRNLSKGI